jgi:hypothetical protein
MTRTSTEIGHCDDPDVDRNRARAAQALELAVLEHSQQLGLKLRRQLADLIQKKGSAVGHFEATHPFGLGPGKGAFLVAEQFAFDQVCRQGRAIDFDQGPGVAGAQLVNGHW